jgi:hypothetical protein
MEIRVTFDRRSGQDSFSVANCTLVQADVVSSIEGDRPNPDAVMKVTHSAVLSAESAVG